MDTLYRSHVVKILTFSFFLFFAASCGEETKSEEQNSEPPKKEYYGSLYKASVTYPKVECRNDNNITYALYLPDDYDTIHKFPVIYFFDAHAEGLLPVNKYKDLANKYGYVLAGNNNSKNGNTIEQNAAFGNSMINDVQKRFSINKDRLYACGFSGGSRVAGYITETNPSMKGIIACSASIPSEGLNKEAGFIYIGIAGTEDFNYTEMKMQNQNLANTQITHELLTFEGKHEWCPPYLMDEAIAGLELDAMKKHLIPQNNLLIDDFISASQIKANHLKKAGKKYDLYNHYLKMVSYLTGLQDVSTFNKKASASK